MMTPIVMSTISVSEMGELKLGIRDTLHHLCYQRLECINRIPFSFYQFFIVDLILLRAMSVFVYEPLEAVLELHFWVRDVDAEEIVLEGSMDEAEETVDQ